MTLRDSPQPRAAAASAIPAAAIPPAVEAQAKAASTLDVCADRCAAVEQELRQFSYIVSHDLGAAFRHMAEFSRLLEKELGGDLTSRQATFAGYIREASARCQAMMEQLLVFSRLQQRPLARVRLDATAAMNLVILQLGDKIRDRGAEIVVEPLDEVFADPTLLSLAFRHLLDNALKFSRPGVPSRISVRGARDGNVWRVRIYDNGVGVAAQSREQVFQMFHHLSAGEASTDVGVGLSICRRIARLHGGDVAFLDSHEGACIELALPIGEADS